MAKVSINQFAGEVPRVEPRYLPDANALIATGCHMRSGALAPMRAPALQHTLTAAASKVFLYGSTFLSWSSDADAAPGPVAQDRLYITRASGAPQMLTGGVFYALALPAPGTAPSLQNLGTPDPELAEAVLYAFTWVTSLGEESTPSPLSGSVMWSAGNVIRVSTATNPPANRLITKKRIYRSQTSSSGATELYFVAEISAATALYDHDASTAPLAEPIPSTDYDPPPSDMRGIVEMPNAMMAAFSGRDVLFCEPFVPHAWPEKYALTVNDQIVGLGAFGTSLAVLTTGTPYVIQGISPESMAMTRLEVDLPCVAKRGIVDMGGALVYPSQDGLVQISNAGASLISAGLWTQEQWKALSPSTIIAARSQGRYVFSAQPGGTGPRALFFVALDGASPYLTRTDHQFIDLLYHLETGRLYGLGAADQRSISAIDDPIGSIGTYRWRSKPFFLPAEVEFGVVRVDAKTTAGAASDALQVKVFRDGTEVRSITGAAQAFDRLPAGRGREWQVEVEGNMTVTAISIASVPDELFN